ncbi:hypothetical protein SAMN05421877_102336 [Sphingobacterium lactis]|uniref:Uncharacterized protein n=1 Tax=Sphingobacterium lactis TaxID=797291 RepID=A0A1H5ULE8_9SPHI|nr:hypothetical protein SAMN05421877_102336 [Sphingobacterium lactis]
MKAIFLTSMTFMFSLGTTVFISKNAYQLSVDYILFFAALFTSIFYLIAIKKRRKKERPSFYK